MEDWEKTEGSSRRRFKSGRSGMRDSIVVHARCGANVPRDDI